jgi:hypothetical protein
LPSERHEVLNDEDPVGHTLTVWLDDPAKEHVCEETTEEVVLMKGADGRVIGFELLHYRPSGAEPGYGAAETLSRKRRRRLLVEHRR